MGFSGPFIAFPILHSVLLAGPVVSNVCSCLLCCHRLLCNGLANEVCKQHGLDSGQDRCEAYYRCKVVETKDMLRCSFASSLLLQSPMLSGLLRDAGGDRDRSFCNVVLCLCNCLNAVPLSVDQISALLGATSLACLPLHGSCLQERLHLVGDQRSRVRLAAFERNLGGDAQPLPVSLLGNRPAKWSVLPVCMWLWQRSMKLEGPCVA